MYNRQRRLHAIKRSMLMGKIVLAYLNKFDKQILNMYIIWSYFAILCGKNPFYGQKSPKKPFNFSRVRYGGVTNDRLRGG